MKKSRRTASGFSLLELLLSMALLMVVMASVFPLLSGGQQIFQAQSANADAIGNARFAMDRVSELIRNAGYDPRRLRFPAVALGPGGTSITVRSDLNGNQNTADILLTQDVVVAPEWLTLSLNGTDLILTDLTPEGVPGVATPIAQNIIELIFTQPSVRVVTVTLTAFTPATGARGVRSVRLSETLFLRNIP